ncbi:hypothetical protein C5167_018400 [Papaver somniferum]|uniref:Uncharacterized protein n=1 Tax=Papaver somniferum TaxID=3469 RepID=A0A4Y7IR78_PAPSO|nr:hypothetical protein C5167_018400 [Papaver somniferum]
MLLIGVLPSTMRVRRLFGCTPHEQSDTKDKMDSKTARVVASTFFRRLTSATRHRLLQLRQNILDGAANIQQHDRSIQDCT